MPLSPYKRGPVWWIKGRVEYNGRPISEYYRCSTGASSEAGARDSITAEEERQRRHHLLSPGAVLTFAELVVLYPAKPADARYLERVIDELGPKLVREITTPAVHALARRLYPAASTDTRKRQVCAPVSAVINHGHALGRCPPIRIKGFSSQERVDQDRKRGRQSRPARPAADWTWIRAVQKHATPYLAAALEFMYETGARVTQTVDLAPGDLDLDNARVWLQGQKGHPAQWVEVSTELAAILRALPPKRPHDRKRGHRLPARVFGYGNRTGLAGALRRACEKAKQPYMTPHEAGRRGFYTELRVRQGVDPITAAKAGRWSDPTLPDRVYARVEAEDRAMRAAIRSTAGVEGL